MILIVVGGIIGYLFTSGMVGYSFYVNRKRRCKECRKYGWEKCYSITASFFGILWPFTVPMLFGALTANYLGDRDGRAERKEQRLDAEHKRKMAELEAQQKLADQQRIATMESVKFLVENGIKADVPGLFDVES